MFIFLLLFLFLFYVYINNCLKIHGKKSQPTPLIRLMNLMDKKKKKKKILNHQKLKKPII